MTDWTEADWSKRGAELFGDNRHDWRFVCPACGHVAAVRDWKDAGASPAAAAFSCVGRWTGATRRAFEDKGPGPCNYAGGGLFAINPDRVITLDGKTYNIFAFAEQDQ